MNGKKIVIIVEEPKRRLNVARVLRSNTLFRQRIVKSKKEYNRKRLKNDLRKDLRNV